MAIHKENDLFEQAKVVVLELMRQEIDRVIAEDLSACESPAEKLFYLGLVAEGLHHKCTIEPQRKVNVLGKEYRIDFAIWFPKMPDDLIPELYAIGRSDLIDRLFPSIRLAIEVDGFDFHDRTRSQATRDRRRDRALTFAGWTVVRFTASEIIGAWKRVVEQEEYHLPFATELYEVLCQRWIEAMKQRD